MASSDWEEIKRLASDFQRAQLTSSLQRLSERNCVEIINKLKELNLISIYHTNDGKEYLTHDQLSREIQDVLYINKGRVDFETISSSLCVDIGLVEKVGSEIFANDKSVHLIFSDLITDYYLDNLTEEINEKLQQNGSINIGNLARDYNLPDTFLLTELVKRLGRILHGEQDRNNADIIYTEMYISKHKYQIKGILTAITIPTHLSATVNSFKLNPSLFMSIAEELISKKVIRGSISGGNNLNAAVYTPHLYTQALFNYAKNFLQQNGYLEYDGLKRIGITEPQSYIQRHFSDHELTYTLEACIGPGLIEQLSVVIEDAIVSGGVVDVSPYVPTSFSLDTCKNLIDLVLERRNAKAIESGYITPTNCRVFCQSVVVSEPLLTKAFVYFEKLMPDKVQTLLKSGVFKQQLDAGKAQPEEQVSKKEERRRKAASGKVGGGTQGRETKTKSVKKFGNKSRKQKTSESEDESTSKRAIEFMSLEEIREHIATFDGLEDCLEELIYEVAAHMYEPLCQTFEKLAKETFTDSMASDGGNRKKDFKNFEEKVTLLYNSIKLGIKGAKEFGDDGLQAQLIKFLLKGQCSELVNELIIYLSSSYNIQIKSDSNLSSETRLKIINKFPEDAKDQFLDLNSSLNQTNIEKFIDAVEDCLSFTNILIKKKDNKRDKQTLSAHRALLLEQFHASSDPALSLHLASLIIFQAVTGNMLHASGKFVPNILSYLKKFLPKEMDELLHNYQVLVMKMLSHKNDSEVVKDCENQLHELTEQLKERVAGFKKSRENEH